MPVFGEKEGNQLRMDLIIVAEFSFKKTTDQTAIHSGIISREMDVNHLFADGFQIFFQFLDLSGLPGPIKTFNYNQHLVIYFSNPKLPPRDKSPQKYIIYIFVAIADFLECPEILSNICRRFIRTAMSDGIKIMGIVNLTDNSYFASSRCLGSDGVPDMDRTMERIGRMLAEGADIIDIGACSTRPGSEPVGEAEECRRLEPVLREAWRRWPSMTISVDTYWAGVAEMAAGIAREAGRSAPPAGAPSSAGATPADRLIINDISAGEDDPEMLPLIGTLGLPYIAMHKRGTPATMQTLCDYSDVTGDLLDYFRKFQEKAASYGIQNWILDPGFGFAKTIEQNYQLLRDLPRFREFGRPILVGISRKSMIYKLFDITPEEALPQTQVLHAFAIRNGASILRVHDVTEAVRTVRTLSLL